MPVKEILSGLGDFQQSPPLSIMFLNYVNFHLIYGPVVQSGRIRPWLYPTKKGGIPSSNIPEPSKAQDLGVSAGPYFPNPSENRVF